MDRFVDSYRIELVMHFSQPSIAISGGCKYQAPVRVEKSDPVPAGDIPKA
jgi:hypothetical protein